MKRIKNLEEDNACQFTTLQDLEWNLYHYVPELKEVAEKPAVENPFKSNLLLTYFDKFKVCLLCILVPFRMLLLGSALCAASITGTVFMLGYKETDPPKPFRGFRKFGQMLVNLFSRICLFACGYHSVKIKGSLLPETRIIVAAPHSSFIDTLVITLVGNLNAVTKTENLEHFFLGNCLRLLQPTAVSRAEKNSKINGVKEIKRRVANNDWYPTLLFPEGTCTNREAYIAFKPGAFYPGLPVQPVIIRYKDRLDYATWTWFGDGAFRLICLMMSQAYNTVELEILPIYTPTQEEINDPLLYARNVREYMAKVDNVPVTDHSYEDCRLMVEAKKVCLPMEAGLVEYHKLNRLIGINCDYMIEQLHKFSKIDLNGDGKVDVDEFCDYLNLPATEEVLSLFKIYDIYQNDGICFREFLIGQFLIAKKFSTEDNIRSVFEILHPYPDRHRFFITVDNLLTYLKQKIDIYDDCVNDIFTEMDVNSEGRVYFQHFKEFCMSKPEFVLLLLDFRQKENITRKDCDTEYEDL